MQAKTSSGASRRVQTTRFPSVRQISKSGIGGLLKLPSNLRARTRNYFAKERSLSHHARDPGMLPNLGDRPRRARSPEVGRVPSAGDAHSKIDASRPTNAQSTPPPISARRSDREQSL